MRDEKYWAAKKAYQDKKAAEGGETPPPAPIPLTPLDEPAAPHDAHLPIVHSVGLAQVKKGWVVVSTKSQGKTIISTEIVSGPDLKPIALESFRLYAVKHIMVEALNGRPLDE